MENKGDSVRQRPWIGWVLLGIGLAGLVYAEYVYIFGW